ncbi:putative odorant receptor 83c [Culex pipiens pallens]|uniref:putative odorant receptor 83c n=1 Tax=Culex pipiens pallens TaxID=42434 RepID=UPI001952F111|nr:putative odorant receptor 83c [Culex pipiens pallens]
MAIMEYIQRLERFKFFQHSFKNPSEFYTSLVEIPNKVARVAGLNIFSKDYKVFSWNLACLLTVFVVYGIVTPFTIYEVRHNVDDLIYCLVTVGIGIQGVMKMITFLVYRKELIWTQEYTQRIYQEESHTHKQVLMGQVSLLNVMTKIIIASYIYLGFLLAMGPFLYSLMAGKKALSFGFWIPYLDRFSWPGYLCNVVMQVIMTLFICSENLGADVLHFMTMMSSRTQVDMLMIKLRSIKSSDLDMRDKLKEIIIRHQEHLEFVATVEMIYRSFFFVIFSTLGATLCLSLYAVATLGWVAGCIPCMFIIYEMFVYCFLATILETKEDELQQEIYKVPWYQLSISDQKSLRIVLGATQQPVCLTLIFYPLSMPTFVDVMKTIYSYLTLLLTFSKA